jgi:hypothetical protein
MRILPLLIANAIVSSLSLVATPAFSQPQPNNPTSFTGTPPSLVTAGSPDTSADQPSARYYFTFKVPKDSPQSVGKVSFTPLPSAQPIVFNLAQTKAIQGTQNKQGSSLPVQASQAKNGAISVQFNSPVPPGTTFTVILKTNKNPSFGGEYTFNVQAFPAGANSTGLDLGIGSFNITTSR